MTKKIQIYKNNMKMIRYYLNIAKHRSTLSCAVKKKVGCVITKNSTLISDGYNRPPAGYDNKCEDLNNKTKWYVIHAEADAILKLTKSNISSNDSTLYTTLSPCRDCAKLILESNISRVYYIEEYKDKTGIIFLNNNSVACHQIHLN